MARINISVSDQLKETMDRLPQVNWSEVARAAFDREVRKNQRIDKMNKATVVNRLQASFEEYVNDMAENGHIFGADWAAETADYGQLLALSELGDAAVTVLADWQVQDTAFDGFDCREFWDIAAGEGTPFPSEEFVRGFVHGALEVFESVKGSLSTKN